MSLFLFPKSFCIDLDAMLRNFRWGFPQDKEKNLTLLSWKSICTLKSIGGLGIITMEFQNRALLSKLGWQIYSNQDLLWVRALKAKYLRNDNFMDISIKNNASWLWKGILNNMLLIEKGHVGLFLRVLVSTFELLHGFLPFPISNPPPPNLYVSDLIDENINYWNSPLIHNLFDPFLASQILNIHIPINPRVDKLVWSPSPQQNFLSNLPMSILSNPKTIEPLPCTF